MEARKRRVDGVAKFGALIPFLPFPSLKISLSLLSLISSPQDSLSFFYRFTDLQIYRLADFDSFYSST